MEFNVRLVIERKRFNIPVEDDECGWETQTPRERAMEQVRSWKRDPDSLIEILLDAEHTIRVEATPEIEGDRWTAVCEGRGDA